MDSKAKIKFALVVHNHQPIGNRDQIIETIYQRSYLPFLSKLSAFPQIRANLHYAGFLLDWIEVHHPEFIELLQKLVQRAQVEICGGAYYEPVISVIPDADTVGQTRLLSDRISALFSRESKGFWLAERAWEPELPEVLNKSGVSYSLVDDVSFESSGLDESGCFEPYLIESRGKFVTIFPILKKLRYYIPFKAVSTTISYLRSAAESDREIAVYADDGEKFGAWPTTYERVYSNGWLDSFFGALLKNDWIETVKLSEYLKFRPASKRIYLPASAYPEMMDWSIPVFPHGSTHQRFRKGERSVSLRGYWRLFLAKYPESARAYAKMLRISELLHSNDQYSSSSGLVELWKSQCNDAYWHGILAGLYSPLLRRNTYEHLIRAQVECDRISAKTTQDKATISESRISGRREIIIETEQLGITVSPSLGGSVSEIDFKPKSLNITDTMARRPERYHRKIKSSIRKSLMTNSNKVRSIHEAPLLREKGLEDLLIYDMYPKLSFLDYLVPVDTKVDSFENQDFDQLAPLADSGYEAVIQKSNDSVTVTLSRTCKCLSGSTLNLTKSLRIPFYSPHLQADYEIGSEGNDKSTAMFLPEINLGSLADNEFPRTFSRPKISAKYRTKIAYPELGVHIELSAEESSSTWILPVKTVSLSEDGFESNIQGISIMPCYQVELDPGREPFRASLQLDLG